MNFRGARSKSPDVSSKRLATEKRPERSASNKNAIEASLVYM